MNSKNFFRFMKLMGKITSIWPLENGANKMQVLIYELKWWISFILICMLMGPLVLGIYYFRKDSFKMAKSLCECVAIGEVFFNILLSRWKNKIFQEILNEIEEFFENPNHHEEMLLNKYMNKNKDFKIATTILFLSISAIFALKNLSNSEILPLDTWYPFPRESLPILIVLYISHTVTAFQSSFGITMDWTISTIFFYATIKIELIEFQMNEAKNKTQLIECVQSYQKLIIFIDKIKQSTQLLILKTCIGMIIIIVSAAVQLIQKESFESTIVFLFMVMAGSMRVYITAKAADDLYESGQKLAEHTFQISMQQSSVSNAKIGLMLAVHCRRPIVISVPGLIKAYTMQYYAGFISTSVGYYLNLRALFDD